MSLRLQNELGSDPGGRPSSPGSHATRLRFPCIKSLQGCGRLEGLAKKCFRLCFQMKWKVDAREGNGEAVLCVRGCC